jgi:hypothetical protein
LKCIKNPPQLESHSFSLPFVVAVFVEVMTLTEQNLDEKLEEENPPLLFQTEK